MERNSNLKRGRGIPSPRFMGWQKNGVWFLVAVSLLFSFTVAVAGPSDLGEVQHLNLVYKGFRLGAKLERSEDLKPLKEALPGTLRFKKGSLVVAVDKKTRHILALYEEFPEVTPQELQELVGKLVGRLGEPTFEAHDKMLYWYFSSKGKISSEALNRMREKGQKPEVLAIVKLYCDHKIVEFGNQKDRKARTKVYVTFYSPLLIHKIMQPWLHKN